MSGRVLWSAAMAASLAGSAAAQGVLTGEADGAGPILSFPDAPGRGFGPVDLVCPDDASPEFEPVCFDGYTDNANGGCNSSPNVFQPLLLDEVVCGTSGFYLAPDSTPLRDTDWYELVIAQTRDITIRGNAEFPYVLGLAGQVVPGLPGCGNYDGSISPGAIGAPGQEVAIVATLEPGTYYVFFAPTFEIDVPCGREYWLAVRSGVLCSDGSGLDVDFDLGVLDPGVAIMQGDTSLYGRGICAYGDGGGPVGRAPQGGGEVITRFRVSTPSVASVEIFADSEGQDFFLLAGTAVTPEADVFGDGSYFGDRADETIGFVEASGPMLDASGEQEVLLPGRDYHFVADTHADDGFFDVDLVLAGGCGRADYAAPLGILDLADIVAWVNLFTSNDPAVDVAPPMGIYDLADIVAFVEAFTGGCR